MANGQFRITARPAPGGKLEIVLHDAEAERPVSTADLSDFWRRLAGTHSGR